MSRLTRKNLQRLILKEFKMIGMTPMGAITPMKSDNMHVGSHEHGCDACGMSPCGRDE